MEKLSIYIHVPFCRHRCPYCDFNTYEGILDIIPEYVNAVCDEIELVTQHISGVRVHTIYFGGGTPSLLPVQALEQLLTTIKNGVELADYVEVTMEANPGSLTLDYIGDIRHLGVNRLSLGMQSANQGELYLLERQHDFIDVIDAVLWGRIAGFDNINLDLIYGLPNQSEMDWESSLISALGLNPEHVSMYALGLEEGTLMHRWVDKGLINTPNPDLAADMYEWATEVLEKAGYYQYELSSWAGKRKEEAKYECKHNLQYWRNQPYLGFGAGAHGFLGSLRVANVGSPFEYIHRMSNCEVGTVENGTYPFPRTPVTSQVDEIDENIEMRETMMMGLRLVGEGISATKFERRFNKSLMEAFEDKIEPLLQNGLLEWEDNNHDTLRLSKRGRLLGNQVFMEFV